MPEDNNERQINIYLAAEICQQLQVFADSKSIAESEAIALILSDYFQSKKISSLPPREDKEKIIEIEDEPDEILWGFIEPEYQDDCIDPDFIDEPDEVLTGFLEYRNRDTIS
jgi:hypothetical protein